MRALVLGVAGQDGSYLAEQLVEEGAEVFGLSRRPATTSSSAQLLYGDLLDGDSLTAALQRARPDVVFNVAAVTSPGGTWRSPQPPLLSDVTAVGVVHLLDAMLDAAPDAHLVHASSSAIYDPHRYGLYGISKRFSHDAVIGYRSRLRCSNAILFSHTSPRQDSRFLAPRIFAAVARMRMGSDERLPLGDVDSRRHWGYAPDFCRAMRAIAVREPGDYVIAQPEQHSVRELVTAALEAAGLTWAKSVDQDAGLPRIPDETAAVPNWGWSGYTGFQDWVRACVEAALESRIP